MIEDIAHDFYPFHWQNSCQSCASFPDSGKEKGALWISARISSTRHTVIRGPSFTGFGKRPDLTPAHQVLFDIGIIAGIGELLVESPMILGNRTKPVSGKGVVVDLLGSMKFSPGVVNNDR
jgi:hypothetical protein